MKKIWVSIILLFLSGMIIAVDKPKPDIDEDTARKLAINHYNELFKDKYVSIESKYVKFPKLDANLNYS